MNQDGGYIFAAAHNIQEDVNPNIMLAAGYRIETASLSAFQFLMELLQG